MITYIDYDSGISLAVQNGNIDKIKRTTPGKFILPDNDTLYNLAKNAQTVYALVDIIGLEEIYRRDYLDGRTSIHIAVGSYGKDDVLEALLRSCNNLQNVIDLMDNCGETALSLAVKYHNIASVKLLIRFGASVDHINSYGHSMIHQAILCKQIELTKILLRFGSMMIDKKDDNGITPIMKVWKSLLRTKEKNVRYKLLLSHGAIPVEYIQKCQGYRKKPISVTEDEAYLIRYYIHFHQSLLARCLFFIL